MWLMSHDKLMSLMLDDETMKRSVSVKIASSILRCTLMKVGRRDGSLCRLVAAFFCAGDNQRCGLFSWFKILATILFFLLN